MAELSYGPETSANNLKQCYLSIVSIEKVRVARLQYLGAPYFGPRQLQPVVSLVDLMQALFL